MNPSEVHLAINHLPIFSTLFGSFILLAGLIFKKDILQLTAYILIIIGTIGALVSVYSGEEAEELIEEKFPEISHQIIHEHEEAAEGARNMSIALGVLSLLAMFLNRTKRPLERLVSWLLFAGAIVCFILLFRAAHSGGEIMHKEIRSDFEYSE